MCVRWRSRLGELLHQQSQFGQVAGLENFANADRASCRRTDARRDPGGVERRTAQCEQVVVHGRFVDADRLRNHLCDESLGRGLCSSVGALVGCRRVRQRFSVEFARGSHRQRPHHDNVGRPHRRRQTPAQVLADAGGETAIVHVRGDVQRQRLGVTRADNHGYRLVHVGMRLGSHRDLTRFDPDAPDLHLVVAASRVVQPA